MSRPNHAIRFTPYADVSRPGMKALIADAEGTACVRFPDGTSATFVATKGTMYQMNFDMIEASGNGVTGTAFY